MSDAGLLPPLHRGSTVLAIVPHYRCEAWLSQALESLTSQTRPLDSIVVVDDGSEEPPVSIVSSFPQVTLMVSPQNVGPFNLIQAVIQSTGYDAYLQQDADDWSTTDRLELLLAEAEATRAELLGTLSLDITYDEDGEHHRQVSHPHDVTAACAEQPGEWFLSWGTSIVTRTLFWRIGGLSTGLSLEADTDFVRRAIHAAQVVNVMRCCYYRRRRADALTSAPDTRYESPARVRERDQSTARAWANVEHLKNGCAPDLTPVAIARPVRLSHALGPTLVPTPKPYEVASR